MFEGSGYFNPSRTIQEKYDNRAAPMDQDNIQLEFGDAEFDYLGFDMHEEVDIAAIFENTLQHYNQNQTYVPDLEFLTQMEASTYHQNQELAAPMFQDTELYQISIPQSYNLFCEVEREVQFVDGGENRNNSLGKGNLVTERQRRGQLNQKYKTLKSLVPKSTKGDRASIVGDAINYIKELLQTKDELKICLDKKKSASFPHQRPKTEDIDTIGGMDCSSRRHIQNDPHSTNGALRCSLVQRKTRESFADVHIIDNEVNIKFNSKKKPNSLVHIAKLLDELQLDVVHVAGGKIADSCVFMLNTKICEGSSVYAGEIAKKLLEVMDRQYQP